MLAALLASGDLALAAGAGVDRGGALRLAGAAIAPRAACTSVASWITARPTASVGPARISACLSPSTTQTGALLNVTNNRDYAQLITITGAPAQVVGLSPSNRPGAQLQRLLAALGGTEDLLVLGPYARATVALDRPPPATAARQIAVSAAGNQLSALAGRAWTVLSAAAHGSSLPALAPGCLATALVGAASSAITPRCVARCDATLRGWRVERRDTSGAAAHGSRRRRAIAAGARPLGRAGGEGSGRDRRLLCDPGSAPGAVDPSIRIGLPALGTVPDGVSTVARLTASGGVAPYRFYLLTEPGGAPVPSWVRLTAAGILTITPPRGASLQLMLLVFAVDATGEYSEDIPE